MAKDRHKFLALLRGINVGGKNIIAKDDLKACFENAGFTGVRTYIQSGNILFRSNRRSVAALTGTVEETLGQRFDDTVRAVVMSHADYAAAVAAAPRQWGIGSTRGHHALFMTGGLSPDDFIDKIKPPKSFERLTPGPGVVFWSIDADKVAQSTFAKLPSNPIYRQVTIRNHNTTRKLLDLFEQI